MVHVLWECSAYSSSRASFMVKLEELLGDRYADFEVLNSVEKTSDVLGSEQNFKSLLSVVKEFIVNMWEVRKRKLYGDDSCPNQLQSQSSPGGLEGATRVEGQRNGKGKLYSVCYACRVYVGACNMCVGSCTCTCQCGCKCKCDNVHSCMDMCTCMCSSAHSCGCVADGGDTMAAF